jgi:hypothetical protein
MYAFLSSHGLGQAEDEGVIGGALRWSGPVLTALAVGLLLIWGARGLTKRSYARVQTARVRHRTRAGAIRAAKRMPRF